MVPSAAGAAKARGFNHGMEAGRTSRSQPSWLSTPKAVLGIKPTQPGFLNHTKKLLLIQKIRIWEKFDLLPLRLFLHPKPSLKRSPATFQGWRISSNTEQGKSASTDKLG